MARDYLFEGMATSIQYCTLQTTPTATKEKLKCQAVHICY